MRFDNSYARLPEQLFARVRPEPAPAPRLVKLNRPLAQELGLDVDWLESEEGVAMLAGKAIAEGSEPIAMAYAGHQFGGWSPRLGDGRAHLLGEIIAPSGERFDLHLKGSGRTPFSRMGDGKAALGPVLREYIVSEFMHAAGVPTSRALAAVLTGEEVMRERPLPGAVLARVARSHVRVGTFQYVLSLGDRDLLQRLTDYVIDRHYPEARESERPALALLEAVVARQAELVAHWMALGFIHGVMNTDNMQIAGETIDYGPCAFMDRFHPATVFSSIDHGGRYAWNNQPNIAIWNLSRFAETLLPLIGDESDAAVAQAQEAVGRFAPRFSAGFARRFGRKLGIPEANTEFIEPTLRTLADQGVDFTAFFTALTRAAGGGPEETVAELFFEKTAGAAWLAEWKARHDPALLPAMRAENPVRIPRNHRVEAALEAANAGDFKPFEQLLEALREPFTEDPELAAYEAPPKPEEVVHQTFCGT